MKTFIFNYEASLFQFIRELIPDIKLLTYANSDDMFYALNDVRKFPCAFYMRDEEEWSLPRIYTFDEYKLSDDERTYDKERMNLSVIEQHYKMRIYVEKQSEMLELANILTASWCDHPYLDVSWEWTHDYIFDDRATTENYERVNMFFTGCKVGEVRPSNDTKGSYRYIEMSWTSQMCLNFVKERTQGVNLVHEVRLYTVPNGDTIVGSPNDGGYVLSVVTCDHKVELRKIAVVAIPSVGHDDFGEMYYYYPYMLDDVVYETTEYDYDEENDIYTFYIEEPTEGKIFFDIEPYRTFEIYLNDCTLSYLDDFTNMFSYIPSLQILDLGSLDTSNGWSFDYFISGNSMLTELRGLERLDFSNGLTFLHFMDGDDRLSRVDLSNADFSNGLFFNYFLSHCGATEILLPTSHYIRGSMSNFLSWCYNVTSLNLIMVDISSSESLEGFLYHATSLRSISNLAPLTSNNKNLSMFLSYCGVTDTLDMTTWDLTQCHDFSYFLHGSNFEHIILPQNVDSFNEGLNCNSFMNGIHAVTLDLSNKRFNKVQNLQSFLSFLYDCTELNLSNCEFDSVSTLSSAITYCNNLTTLNLSGIQFNEDVSLGNILQGCTVLTTIYAIGCSDNLINTLRTNAPSGCTIITE